MNSEIELRILTDGHGASQWYDVPFINEVKMIAVTKNIT
jgi:hypothetical protein